MYFSVSDYIPTAFVKAITQFWYVWLLFGALALGKIILYAIKNQQLAKFEKYLEAMFEPKDLAFKNQVELRNRKGVVKQLLKIKESGEKITTHSDMSSINMKTDTCVKCGERGK